MITDFDSYSFQIVNIFIKQSNIYLFRNKRKIPPFSTYGLKTLHLVGRILIIQLNNSRQFLEKKITL